MLPRRGFFDASQKGFFTYQVILMDLLCAYNRSRGDLGEINTGAQLLPSSEGSLGSRCRSRKLGKCRTLLCLGLILTPMRGWIDEHSTSQLEIIMSREWYCCILPGHTFSFYPAVLYGYGRKLDQFMGIVVKSSGCFSFVFGCGTRRMRRVFPRKVEVKGSTARPRVLARDHFVTELTGNL